MSKITLPRPTQAQIRQYPITQFINKDQLALIRKFCNGEEGQWFQNKVTELINIFAGMPKSYEQDGKGDKALVYLHYFRGGMDYWITEKDVNSDNEGQIQAFGYVDHGHGGKLGYVSIQELLKHNFEIDLHWEIKTLAKVKKSRK